MKGQLMSADLIISVSLFALAIGLLASAFDSASRPKAVSAGDAAAAAIAEALAGGNASAFPTSAYCYSYSNGTGSCADFSCINGVSASHRVVGCGGSINYCLLEVRACR